jgi:hypothetical protein
VNFNVGWIYGVMFGIEFMDADQCMETDIAWGFTVDLFILRISVWREWMDEHPV